MRRTATLTAAAMLALGTIGCPGDDDDAPRDAGPLHDGAARSAPTSKIKAGGSYVALGSSIASGFGISVQSMSCGRSNRNYANLIAARLRLTLTDVSCGAATIPNVVDTAQGANPPQIQAISADTDLITVSVGGNDIFYNGTTYGCANPATECSAPADLDARVAATGPALVAMFDAIRAAAPEATIVLVSYPREIPDANCPELSLTDTEHALVLDMGTRLEQIFVDVAGKTDVVFVDPYVEPGDHTGCAPAEERWTAGAVADDGFAFHPTALGHEVMARMITEALGG